ncbi:MAG: hypothetical protein IPK97_10525 [Ahniella sp.]|nr:hypothetical protein [Ahniella sp.]
MLGVSVPTIVRDTHRSGVPAGGTGRASWRAQISGLTLGAVLHWKLEIAPGNRHSGRLIDTRRMNRPPVT